jgi:hypothetical protein
MTSYEQPTIEELGSIEAFTRGEKFAWELDGMTLAEALGHVAHGGSVSDVIGTS